MKNTPQQILILDDDQALGDLLKAYLETSGPFQIHQIFFGRDLLPTLASDSYHLLLLDFQLPDTTGLDVLEELADSDYHMPVIMMSGKGDQRVAALAIQRGAADYLVKGEDFLTDLPNLIRNTIQNHEIKEVARRSMEEAQYQALLLDNMRDAVIVWNLEGIISFWNPAAYLLFGYKPQDMVGKLVQDVYLNLFKPSVKMPNPENTATAEMEREYLRKDGRKMWLSSRLMPLRSGDRPQKVIGYMDVVRDISRRKQVQLALQESQNFVQKIIDTTPNIIFIFDPKRGVSFINQMLGEILGYTPDEFKKMEPEAIADLIYPDDRESFDQKIAALNHVVEGEVVLSEFRIQDKSRKWHWLACRMSVFSRNADGQPEQIIGAGEDITDRKLKDARIQRANTQLMHAARLSAVGQLATGVAHQVSNPLTSILGETQLLLRSIDPDDPIRESIETIEQAGWRAQWAVQILNTYSEPPSNTIGSVDVYETLRLAISLVGVNLQSEGVTIELNLDGDHPQIQGNPRQIEALWVNFLLFFRSIIRNQSVSLKIQSNPSNGTKVAFDFVLDGISVSEEHLRTIFDEDRVLSSGSTVSGMEYSICQEIVRQNQGSIEVTIGCNQSTFKVILPRER